MNISRILFVLVTLITLVRCQDGGQSEILGHNGNPNQYRKCSIQEPDVASHSLLLAAAAGDAGEVQRLASSGLYDINARVGPLGRSALICAIENGHVGVVDFLVNAAGAFPNQSDNAGNLALHFAIWNGDVNSAEVLLTANADVSILGPAQTNAYDEALRFNDPTMVALLTRFNGRPSGAGRMGAGPGMGMGPGMGAGVGGMAMGPGRPGAGGPIGVSPAGGMPPGAMGVPGGGISGPGGGTPPATGTRMTPPMTGQGRVPVGPNTLGGRPGMGAYPGMVQPGGMTSGPGTGPGAGLVSPGAINGQPGAMGNVPGNRFGTVQPVGPNGSGSIPQSRSNGALPPSGASGPVIDYPEPDAPVTDTNGAPDVVTSNGVRTNRGSLAQPQVRFRRAGFRNN